MLKRMITEKLEDAIEHVPAVVLLGARQVGKTTLAKAVGKTCHSIYLDLESPSDLLKLRDPLSFLRKHRDKLIILDEVQHAPDLFGTLRGLIDENRQAGRKGEAVPAPRLRVPWTCCASPRRVLQDASATSR